jgi:hypothetical protein
MEIDWVFEDPIPEQVSQTLEDVEVDDGLAK